MQRWTPDRQYIDGPGQSLKPTPRIGRKKHSVVLSREWGNEVYRIVRGIGVIAMYALISYYALGREKLHGTFRVRDLKVWKNCLLASRIYLLESPSLELFIFLDPLRIPSGSLSFCAR